MKIKKLILVIIIVIIVLILMLMVLLHQTKLFENAKSTVSKFVAGDTINNENPDMIVDITNIINDSYPEHEHVWYEEYDETNHWSKCSICKEVKNFAEHALTTIWALGYESCESSNSHLTVCECGYGYTGRKPCVWNGNWESQYVGANAHNRRCINCNSPIGTRPYIDNSNGGILFEDVSEEVNTTGILPRRLLCTISNGELRPCGSNERCVICNGPVRKSALHYYAALDGNTIKCQICGKIRRKL